MTAAAIPNFIAGEWADAAGADALGVENPATVQTIAQVPLIRDISLIPIHPFYRLPPAF